VWQRVACRKTQRSSWFGTRTAIDFLETSDGGYQRVQTLELSADDEIDLEGLTRHGDGNTFFALGSHSSRRTNVNNRPRGHTRNLERFEDDSPDTGSRSDRLIRLELAADGTIAEVPVDIDGLRQALETDSVMTHFVGIPSKENGVDLEGIASDGTDLYLGCRGPVLGSV